MKFLAIDTSDKRVCVAAVNGEKECVRTSSGVTSVNLMGELDEALSAVGLLARDADFFACVVGPGSFTGIRIGISTVKGLCAALGTPALSVTSFDLLAYAETGKVLALIDAGHGNFYARPYRDGAAEKAFFCAAEEVAAYREKGYRLLASGQIFEGAEMRRPENGLIGAVKKSCGNTVDGSTLAALYLRKSSAEENRKG